MSRSVAAEWAIFSPSLNPGRRTRSPASFGPDGVISERETQQIEAAKASGRTPVVLLHGLWLLPSSWANWAQLFEEAGYAALTPG